MKPVDNQCIAQPHSRSYWQRAAAVIAIAVGLSILSVSSSLAGPGNPGVFPPDSHPYGATYGEWGARWLQWAYSIPFGVNPTANDLTGAQCGINQNGPVWFLAGTASTAVVTRTCKIPAGLAIFFPIININNDYPCPEPPPFEPAPGQSVEDFLTQGARAVIDTVTSLEVDLDGKSLTNLFDFRATSKLFPFTGAPDLASHVDPCVTGSPQLGVGDGYYVMLKPLAVGSHTLHLKGVNPGFSTEATYHLSIVHGK